MKKTIILLITVLVGCFACDRIGGMLFDVIHKHSNSITAYKYRQLFSETNADLVLMGTSRCEAHYDTEILQDSLNISVYNGGVDGSDNIYSQYIALCLMLQHHVPKYVGLELRRYDFEKTEGEFNTLTYLLPYIGQSNDADTLFMHSGLYWKGIVSHLYRYNAKSMSDIAGYFISYNKYAQTGYIPKAQPPVFPQEKISVESSTVDSLKVHYLDQFAKKCRDNNVTLFCMISPEYRDTDKETYAYLDAWAEKNNIVLWDYSSQHLFADQPELFYDAAHLWEKGATEYSKIFAHDLRLSRIISTE